MTTKAPPRHEALRLAQETMELVGPKTSINLTDTKYALYALSQCVMRLAEECEALNRSKAEDSHGH